MGGFANSISNNIDCVFANNADFSGNTSPADTNGLQTNGQLWIGTTAVNPGNTHINVGTLTSSTLSIGYSSPNITIESKGGGIPVEQLTVDAGQVIIASGTPENITLTGNTVANGTFSKSVFLAKTGTSTGTVNVQVSKAIASADLTKVGLSNFDTTSFAVDTNGFVTLQPIAIPAQSTNLGIAYSSPTFTVQGYNGTALSSTNPAYVWLQSSSSPGKLIRYKITANQTFTDGAAGGLATQRFGVTVSVNWATDCPFYLYAVGNSAETAIAFMISRIPGQSISPAAAGIGQSGSIVNVNQYDMFSLASITTSDYASQPCVCLGSFRMQFTGATNSWATSALSATKDGIGNFNEKTLFTYPPAQNGAVTTNFVQDGNAPTWGTMTATYNINRYGNVNYFLFYANLTGNGSTATQYKPTVPLYSNLSSNAAIGWYQTAAVNINILACSWTSPNYFFTLQPNGAAQPLREQDVAGGALAAAQLSFTINYFV